jgi:opacity protein-like surface antigen
MKTVKKFPGPFFLTRFRTLRPAKMARLMVSALLLLAFHTRSEAQSFQAGIDFTTVFPRGEFKQNIDNNGYGVGGQFLFRLGGTPLYAGFDGGFGVYGSQSRREILSPSIPELRLKVSTDNNIAWTHFLLRLQPRRGKVRPYVDGLIGVKYLFTNTTISDDASGNDIASDTNFSDTTISYGVGGGLQIHLADLSRRSAIVFDTKVRYLRGGRADYLKPGSIVRTPTGVFFDVLSSRTDTVNLQAGVTFRF